jgi:RimJ/RimL family protein N-acetyltransferase
LKSPDEPEAGIPVLETARLRLRPHQMSDLDASAAMWTDPAVVRYIGGQTFSREQTWGRLLRYRGMWALMGFGFWALEDKATGRFLGEAGLLEVRRELVPPIEGTLELGWALIPEAQGRGFASEAVAAIIVWAGKSFPGHQ